MITSFKQWWAQPFNSQQGVWNWTLTIGFILVCVFLWSRVISMLTAIEETVTEAVAS